MEVGPLGSPCRRRSQTAAVSCRSRAGVGSDCGKGPKSAGQVCDEKTNVSEPLLTHRNKRRRHRNRGRLSTSGERRASGTPRAGERPACGPGGVRCEGGVSSLQALAGNRRTCRLDTDGQSKWVKLAPWLREGGPRPAETGRGRVPMRGTGADRLAVVMKAL
jgi:hypothetical protein